MTLVLKDTQKCAMAVTPVDAKGNPASVDGPPSWTVLGNLIVTLEPSDDGLSCNVYATGTLGSTQVQVTADADLGDGVVPITGLLDVQVVGGDAVSLSIAAGTPEEQ
ncbi:hypothetical protein [Trichococcus shcherbakoviae]|uniref:hypothetical protein n=1 Tax=Trichococcus shcherbakoviae TaxID=2094020 RepID=UPI002AA95796|nr:hypothetical protein [Trichococcus shcherbakoviae]